MMKIFKHRHFQQWLKSEKLTDESLKKAVTEIDRGLHDGDLGSGLYKKRVAMPGKGKRGSYRTLLALKHGESAFFVYGYAKNVKANLNEKEQVVYKALAKALLSLDAKAVENMLKTSTLIEVK
ncbi:type II toxin-antitoxin system RelE/ParE family toxin [soil metagenome]